MTSGSEGILDVSGTSDGSVTANSLPNRRRATDLIRTTMSLVPSRTNAVLALLLC